MTGSFEHIKKAYFLGVGGIGMSALARYFNARGIQVAGYDKTETSLTMELNREGISVSYVDDPAKLPAWLNIDSDLSDVLVVYTPAIPNDLMKLVHLKAMGIRIWKRSEVLGEITRGVHTIAVAGTHGKTTTSTMIAHLLLHAGRNVTAFLGGLSSNYNSNLLLASKNENEIMVAEADEYDRSFLRLNPNVSVITSLDADHLDIYGNHQSMVDCYTEFASRLKPGGTLLAKAGVEQISSIKPTHTYSATTAGDYQATNLRIEHGAYVFDVMGPDCKVADIMLFCPGRHNVENAVAATVVCQQEGLTPDEIRTGMASFKGVHRRFDYKLKNQYRVVIDDYAHHPTELHAAIQTVRELYPNKKILGVFQPHLYSRTRDFAAGFAKSLSELDELIMLDIYPARELPIPGITSTMVLDQCTVKRKSLVVKHDLARRVSESDAEVVLILGAGDIDALVEGIVDAISNKTKIQSLN